MAGFMIGKYGMWVVSAGILASGLACSGSPDDGFASEDNVDGLAGNDLAGSDLASDDQRADDLAGDEISADAELGQSQQAWSWWYPSFTSSCSDPTGTDSVLAAIAVATAQELRRWQPLTDFQVSNSMLVLTTAGKARCADGKCFNTQALLDLQKDAASNVQVRPGVKLSPSGLRSRLTKNWQSQKNCSYYWGIFSCKAPEHEFKFLQSSPGSCDTNYWFEVRTPLGSLLSSSGLQDLKEKLVWVDEEDNSYIQFQTSGNTIAIDPTYGLNATTTTQTGSCSAACTKMSSTDITGSCCSCNGTKKYSRSAWSTSTYLCQ